MRDVTFFRSVMANQQRQNERLAPGNAEYGSNVLPLLELYVSLSEADEKRSFRDALEELLSNADGSKRSFAIDVCLGFVIFRKIL